MVRIHEWKEFENSARDMFSKKPTATKFSVSNKAKTTEKDGIPKKKVVATLKVTDGAKVVTFETNERFYAKRVTALMQWFTAKMATDEDLTAEASLKQQVPR
jgi:hypothetical protein